MVERGFWVAGRASSFGGKGFSPIGTTVGMGLGGVCMGARDGLDGLLEAGILVMRLCLTATIR